MISGPAAGRLALSRRVAATTSARGTVNGAAQRIARGLVGTLAFYLCLAAMSPAAEKSKDASALPVKLFVDVTSTRLVDQVKTTDKKRLDLAGVPVMLGALRQDGGALPSIAAGISGSYDFKLGNGVEVKANGYLARVHTEGLGVLQDARAGGDLTFQYAKGGTSLSLKPSARAAFQNDALGHVDYGLHANARRNIVKGLDLSLSAGQAWRVSEVLETDNRRNGFGRIGLRVNLRDVTDLPDEFRGHIEFGYDLDHGDGPLAWQRRMGHGPSLSALLEPAKGWRVSGRYRFSDTARGHDDNDPDARRHERRHRLNLEGDWALESLTGADWHVKACYVYERIDNDVPVAMPESHVATVQFALNF